MAHFGTAYSSEDATEVLGVSSRPSHGVFSGIGTGELWEGSLE